MLMAASNEKPSPAENLYFMSRDLKMLKVELTSKKKNMPSFSIKVSVLENRVWHHKHN